MTNKFKALINKFKKNKNDSSDIQDENLTKDLPRTPKDIEKTDDIDFANSKLSLGDKLSNLKAQLAHKFSRFSYKRKKTMSIPEERKVAQKRKIKIKTIPISSFDINKLEAFFLGQKSQNKLHKIFQFTIVFLLVFTAGKLTGIALEKVAVKDSLKGQSFAKIDRSRLLKSDTIISIRNRNIFNTGQTIIDTPTVKEKEPVKSDLACLEAKRKSNLPIKLINTVVLQDSVKSIASVQVRSESLFRELRVGEKINDMAKIDKIERLKLIVKNLKTGTCESIENSKVDRSSLKPLTVMSKSQGNAYKKSLNKVKGIKNEGNKFTIKKSFLKEKMKNIGDILTQAVGTQINNPDGTISFKITNIVPGSVFSALGINNNDIINEIGGQKIQDLNSIMGTFGKLQTLDQTSIGFKRNGAKVVQEYEFK